MRPKFVFSMLVPVAVLLTHSARAEAPVGLLQLLTGFSAKESCSCAFVVGQSDEYCQAFGQQPGYAAKVSIDRAAKTVTSTFMGVSRTAKAAPGAGCTLDPL